MTLSKVIRGPRVQGVPDAGFLRVQYQSRYVDSSGRATQGEYTAVWDNPSGSWKDALTGADFYIVAAGVGDPVPPEVIFIETFRYGAESRSGAWTARPVVNTLITDFDYAASAPNGSYVATVPLGLQAIEAASAAALAIINALPSDALRVSQLGNTVQRFPIVPNDLPNGIPASKISGSIPNKLQIGPAFTVPAGLTDIAVTGLPSATGVFALNTAIAVTAPYLGGSIPGTLRYDATTTGLFRRTTAGSAQVIDAGTSLLMGEIDGGAVGRLTILETDVPPLKTFRTKIGVLSASVANVFTPAAAPTQVNTTSTFSGYGTFYGVKAAFNRITLKIWPFDAASLPTKVRLRIRQNDKNSTIIYDSGAAGQDIVGAALNVAQDVVFDLGATIDQGATPIAVEYLTNGKVSLANVTAQSAHPANPNYWYFTGNSLTTATGISATSPSSDNVDGYVKFDLVTADNSLAFNTVFNAAMQATHIDPLKSFYSEAFKFGRTSKFWGTIKPAFLTGSERTPLARGSLNTVLSTITGWGSSLGVISGSFDSVIIPLLPNNPAFPITKLRVRIKENNTGGALLGDATVDVSGLDYASLTPQEIAVTFSSAITNANRLWCEFYTDGRVGVVLAASGVFTEASGYPRSQYTTSTAYSGSPAMTNAASEQFYLVRVGNIDTTKSEIDFSTGKARAALNPAWSATLTVAAVTPAVVGRECNIYFDGIINTLGNASEYEINVVCTKGLQQRERWTLTPVVGDVGTTALSIQLIYRGEIIYTATSSLIVAAANAGGGKTVPVLAISDSTAANGIWLTELKAVADADASFVANTTSLRLTEVGTRGTAPNKHEAQSGWTVQQHFNDPTSPFVFSGVFDFAQYKTANGISVANGIVVIHLGINDEFSFLTTAEADVKATEMIGRLNTMIASIQAAEPTAKVVIMETIAPSVSQDSFGNALNYSSGQTRAQYNRNKCVWNARAKAAFEGRTGSGIYWGKFSGLDNDNNMVRDAPVPVNSRNSSTIIRMGNGVHPSGNAASFGYGQMADDVYNLLKWIFA